jgi:hypothetical protein
LNGPPRAINGGGLDRERLGVGFGNSNKAFGVSPLFKLLFCDCIEDLWEFPLGETQEHQKNYNQGGAELGQQLCVSARHDWKDS